MMAPGSRDRADSRGRDLRVDFFRGLALIVIFINHVPGNSLSHFTLQAFGFSDAAEVFVLIAGYSAFMAYSGPLQRQGLLLGARQVLQRVRDIYAAHLILVAICASVLAIAARYFENPLYFEHVNLTPLSYDPLSAIWNVLLLTFQPGYLNILPLYVVLLAWFPVLWWLLQRNPLAALGISVALWAGARFGLKLPSWPETIGWFFNPFAWQLLFAIGAIAALGTRRGWALPRNRWIIATAALYVLGIAIVAAPWVNIPGLDLPRVVPLELIPTITKTNLSIWRLTHILAIAYLVAVALPPTARWLSGAMARPMIACGRHGLHIFSLGTVLSFLGFAVMLEGGRSWPYQIAVNGIGVGVLLCTAMWLERRKARRAVVVGQGMVPLTVSSGRATPSAERH
jgi:hypothetical protein